VERLDAFLSSGSQYFIHPRQQYPGNVWEENADVSWRNAVFALDENAKKTALEKVQRIWNREAPWVYIYEPALVHAVKSKWENVLPRSVPGYGLSAVLPRIFEKELR